LCNLYLLTIYLIFWSYEIFFCIFTQVVLTVCKCRNISEINTKFIHITYIMVCWNTNIFLFLLSIFLDLIFHFLLSIFLDLIFLFLLSIFLDLIFLFYFSWIMNRHVTAVTWYITWCKVIGLDSGRRG